MLTETLQNTQQLVAADAMPMCDSNRDLPWRRALGQNFVVSEKVIQDIVACAGVQEGDAVLEIGPGLGSLTDALLTAGGCRATAPA